MDRYQGEPPQSGAVESSHVTNEQGELSHQHSNSEEEIFRVMRKMITRPYILNRKTKLNYSLKEFIRQPSLSESIQ